MPPTSSVLQVVAAKESDALTHPPRPHTPDSSERHARPSEPLTPTLCPLACLPRCRAARKCMGVLASITSGPRRLSATYALATYKGRSVASATISDLRLGPANATALPVCFRLPSHGACSTLAELCYDGSRRGGRAQACQVALRTSALVKVKGKGGKRQRKVCCSSCHADANPLLVAG